MPPDLVTIAKTVSAISSFVSGAGLKTAISSIIGDTALDAARTALDTAVIAADSRAAINSAITHLETAHAAYSRIWKSAGISGFVKSRISMKACNDAAQKDVWVCSLIAICYTWLGEPRVSRKFLKLAQEAFDDNIPDSFFDYFDLGANIAGVPISLLNPRNLFPTKILMKKSKFIEFREALERTGNIPVLTEATAKCVPTLRVGECIDLRLPESLYSNKRWSIEIAPSAAIGISNDTWTPSTSLIGGLRGDAVIHEFELCTKKPGSVWVHARHGHRNKAQFERSLAFRVTINA